MQTNQHSDDVQAIEALVTRQFASLNWRPGTSGNWTASDRERLAFVYRDALPLAVQPSPEDLLDGLACCRIYIAVQWLGWSRDWTPPAEHAHNWLADAVETAGELAA